MDQLVAEAYGHLETPDLDGLAGRVTEVLRTGEPPAEERGSPQAGELETNMLCRHGGQAGLDGDVREDTAAAVCGGGHTR